MSKTVALPIPTAKTAMMPEESRSAFNVLPHPTDTSLFLNTLVSARTVSMMKEESASHAHQVVPLVPAPLNVLNVLPLPTQPTTVPAHALKVTSLPVTQSDIARDANHTV